MEEQTAKRTKTGSSEVAGGVINEAEEIKQFSSHALHTLGKRLDEEINTPIVPIYVRVQEEVVVSTYVESWVELDLTEDDGRRGSGSSPVKFSYADHVMFKSNFPIELTDLVDYGCGVWNSKIIIAGGQLKSSKCRYHVCSDKIYVYDTVEKSWETHKMKSKRGEVPIVVVAEDRVFIFDGRPERAHLDDDSPFWDEDYEQDDEDEDDEDESLLMFPRMRVKKYCEYFDFKSGTPTPCEYLPITKVPEIPDADGLVNYAVYPNNTMILIWVSCRHIVSLDYITLQWNLYLKLDPMPDNMPKSLHSQNTKLNTRLFSAPYMCSDFVVVEDFLFWKDYNTIYAFDLYGHITLPVYTFPDFEIYYPPFHCFCQHFPLGNCYSCLLSIGNRMLCLLTNTKKAQICFATFKVIISMGADRVRSLHLVLDRAGCLNTPAVFVDRAFSISTSCAFGISTS